MCCDRDKKPASSEKVRISALSQLGPVRMVSHLYAMHTTATSFDNKLLQPDNFGSNCESLQIILALQAALQRQLPFNLIGYTICCQTILFGSIYTILKIVTSPFAAIAIEIRVIKSASTLIIFIQILKFAFRVVQNRIFLKNYLHPSITNCAVLLCPNTKKRSKGLLTRLKFSVGPNWLCPFEWLSNDIFACHPCCNLPKNFNLQTTKKYFLILFFCITFNPTIQYKTYLNLLELQSQE